MNTLNLIELDSIDTRDKIFISIGLYYTQKGEIVPQYIEWEDGRIFWVEETHYE